MVVPLDARKKLIGHNIRTIREGVGETQQELASVISVQKQTISNYERGVSEPDTGTLRSIADHYGIPVGMLMDDPIPELKPAFQAEHLADDFSDYASSLFPLFEPEELSDDPDFSRAYHVCESMMSLGIIDTETAAEALDALCDIYDREHSAKVLADALVIWLNIAFAMRTGDPNPQLVALLASDDFKGGKSSLAIKDMVRSTQKSDLEKGELAMLREVTVEFIKTLKGHRGFEDLAYYYVAIGYLCGAMDEDLDLPESQQLAFSMLFSMGSIGNRYARRAILGMLALYLEAPGVKDA